jgi:hypothetical protein
MTNDFEKRTLEMTIGQEPVDGLLMRCTAFRTFDLAAAQRIAHPLQAIGAEHMAAWQAARVLEEIETNSTREHFGVHAEKLILIDNFRHFHNLRNLLIDAAAIRGRWAFAHCIFKETFWLQADKLVYSLKVEHL